MKKKHYMIVLLMFLFCFPLSEDKERIKRVKREILFQNSAQLVNTTNEDSPLDQ